MAATEFKRHVIRVGWNEPDDDFPTGWDFSIEAAARDTDRHGNMSFRVEATSDQGQALMVWSNEIDHYIELFQAMKEYAHKEEN